MIAFAQDRSSCSIPSHQRTFSPFFFSLVGREKSMSIPSAFFYRTTGGNILPGFQLKNISKTFCVGHVRIIIIIFFELSLSIFSFLVLLFSAAMLENNLSRSLPLSSLFLGHYEGSLVSFTSLSQFAHFDSRSSFRYSFLDIHGHSIHASVLSSHLLCLPSICRSLQTARLA